VSWLGGEGEYMPPRRFFAPFAVAALSAALLSPAGRAPAQGGGGAPPLYRVIDLGEDTGGPVSLNNRGEVVIGAAKVGGESYSSRWAKGTAARLPARGFVATDVSDTGAVAGLAQIGRGPDGEPITHAALLNGSRLKDLTPEDTVETRAVSINRAGWVAVASQQGQIFDGVGARELGQSEGAIDPFVPVEVADNGAVFGNEGPDAFRWRANDWTQLDHAPGHDTAAVKGCSPSGAFACGYGTTDGGEDAHAVLWKGPVPVRLAEYGANYGTVATSVNDRGTAVGYALKQGSFPALSDAGPRPSAARRVAALRGAFASPRMDTGVKPLRACLWTGGKNYDLNALITRGSGWTLLAAYEVNNAGQIVGVGEVKRQRRVFLLVPAR
jgi:uncharacterized membrane protein